VTQTTGDADRPTAKLPDTPLMRLLSFRTLQKLQDRFSALGKITVCICTVQGDPITAPSWGSRYSELIGTSDLGRTAFAEAVRTCAGSTKKRTPVTCHDGMTLHATPIMHDDGALAVIVVGTRAPVLPPPEEIRAVAKKYGADAATLTGCAGQIDPYSGGEPDAISRFADVLADTIATLYAQALRIERQLADLAAVHGLAELLTGTRDLQEILDITVKRVVELMGAKACAIRLLDPETSELVIEAAHNLSEEYLRKGPVILQDGTIDATAFAGRTVYTPDVRSDSRTRYPEEARREGLVSGLSVPLTYRGQTIGVIRVYMAKRYEFSESEQSLLKSVSSQAAAAIITARLWKEHAEAERFERQVEAAAEIQRRMLPAHVPQHPRLQFGCVYDPTLLVGGDFYDFIELSKGRIGVCIADVVGKGLPAALLMASVRAALRSYAPRTPDVEGVVARVNRDMFRDTLSSEFATLVYGVFSADGNTFAYCNAGHNPPLLFRDDRFTELTVGGLVIGVQPAETFQPAAVPLKPDDTLVMVTDGVTEAMDFEGRSYGRDRLLSSIRRHQALDAQQLAQQLLWDVRRFAGLAEQSDDITIVVVKVC
jgi:sigma-B regulation protein RsbU (phosphoserine phosphatase)